jgi:hypothetical protein
MANIKAAANGNWSATATWEGGVIPVAGDDVWANGRTITLNQDISVASLNTTSVAGIPFNGGSTFSNAGGAFNAGPLVENITVVDITAGTSTCLTVLNTNSLLTINVSGTVSSSTTSASQRGITSNTIGTLTINGGTFSGSTNSSVAVDVLSLGGSVGSNTFVYGTLQSRWGGMNVSTAGTVTFTGTVVANNNSSPITTIPSGTFNLNSDLISPSNMTATMLNSAGVGTINVTGNVQASTGIGSVSAITYSGSGTLTVTGNITGGAASSHGASNTGSGTVIINGTAAAHNNGGNGALNQSSGTLIVTRAKGNGFGVNTVGITAATGVSSSNPNSKNFVKELEFGSLGMSPIGAVAVTLIPDIDNKVIFSTSTSGTKTLVDAAASADFPAVGNVRQGTSYNVGNLVGTLAVPPVGSVALGVPVDATTGTAVLTASDVQTALTSQGLTTTRAANLDNLDASVSSRSTLTAPQVQAAVLPIL